MLLFILFSQFDKFLNISGLSHIDYNKRCVIPWAGPALDIPSMLQG